MIPVLNHMHTIAEKISSRVGFKQLVVVTSSVCSIASNSAHGRNEES